MKQVQLIQITPEQLQASIIEGVKEQLDDLKKNYEPKKPVEFLTRAEVADLLKIDISTVHNWTVKGILKSHGIGRRVYYKRVEIENAIVELNK